MPAEILPIGDQVSFRQLSGVKGADHRLIMGLHIAILHRKPLRPFDQLMHGKFMPEHGTKVHRLAAVGHRITPRV